MTMHQRNHAHLEFDTATLMASKNIDVGQSVTTLGDVTKGDGLGAGYLVVAPTAPGPDDVTLANGNIAVIQVLNPASVPSGVGGVQSVSAAPGVLVTGTADDPITGLDYSVSTSSPVSVGSTVNGHLWFVVDP